MYICINNIFTYDTVLWTKNSLLSYPITVQRDNGRPPWHPIDIENLLGGRPVHPSVPAIERVYACSQLKLKREKNNNN